MTGGSYSLGKNVFEVGGNLLAQELLGTSTGDKHDNGTAKQAATKFITDTITSTMINGNLSFGEPTIAPGLHVMSGMTGGDTYVFEGFWLGAAVLEGPSVNAAGVDLNFGYDTLDFSAIQSDLVFDVHSVTPDNWEYWNDVTDGWLSGQPSGVYLNVVLVRNNALASLFQQIPGADPDPAYGLNYVVATGIENIIGGAGGNTVNFHGTGRLDGFVNSHDLGTINFNYDNYDIASAVDRTINSTTYDGVVIDATAGTEFEVLPSINLPYGLGDYPGIGVAWGKQQEYGKSPFRTRSIISGENVWTVRP